jgi:cation transport ATPase
MSNEVPPTAGGPEAGSRPIRHAAGLLLAVQAVLMLGALPVVALMFLGSLWEGGDTDMKHRLLGWALFAVLGNLAGTALFGMAATAAFRHKAERRATAMACAILLAVLASGWAWVFQGQLVSDLPTLEEWALLTVPGLLGSGMAVVAAPET